MLYKKLKLLLFRRDIFVSLLLLLLLSLYYLLFINKGLVLSDEGYYAHYASRILQGQFPYKDFDLQYPPGFFYLLAGFYKFFGASILVGRSLALLLYVSVAAVSFYLLHELDISSQKAKIATFFIFAAFGYPLINIPIVILPTMVVTGLVMIFIIKWFKTNNKKYLVYIGVLLGVQVFLKQNIALAEIVLVNALLLFESRKSFPKIGKCLFFVNTTWIAPTLVWVYVFFFYNNSEAFYSFIAFNKRYLTIWPFSYPPLAFLLQPLGLFKLIPYYLPILFLVFLIIKVLRKKEDKRLLVLFLPLAGFFTTIYPTSDLLHVYPYLSLVLVSLLIFTAYTKRFTLMWYVLLVLSVGTGFYLTLFREYYRYQPPYRFENTAIHMPRANDILVDNAQAHNLTALATFINDHTKKTDYIFVYSFSPMLYFLLDRPNPSPYVIYYPGYLTTAQENATIRNIEKKHVRYLITDGFDSMQTPLAKWILSKKKLGVYGQFTLYDALQ